MNSLNPGNKKGIFITSEDKVVVEIHLSNGEVWKREYNQSDIIGTIINDFKKDNNEEIPDEYMDDWKHNHPSFSNYEEIRTLLVQEVPTIIVDHGMKKRPLAIGDVKMSDVIGKPFSDPFEVFVFHKKDKSLKIQKYDNEIIENNGLDNYGPSSAYCNGNNNLFISGGEKRNSEIVESIWTLDLEKPKVNEVKMPAKKNHSMIYIPNNYVFIVGGNDLKTFYYDSEGDEIYEWSDLNKKRIEPALALISNNLYCFDNTNSRINQELTFEKTDLTSNNPEWTIITPKIQPDIEKINQKFFGVLKNIDNNIIFIGGIMDEEDKDLIKNNYIYDINKNEIENSNIPFTEYNLKEKTFLAYKVGIDYILPDFNRHHPEVLFYQKSKNRLSLVKYEPSHESQLRAKLRQKRTFDYNFNMPLISIPKNEHIIEDNIDYNKDMNKEENNKNDNQENVSIKKDDDIKIGNLDFNVDKIGYDDHLKENDANINIGAGNSQFNLIVDKKEDEEQDDIKLKGEFKTNEPNINAQIPNIQYSSKAIFTNDGNNHKEENTLENNIEKPKIDIEIGTKDITPFLSNKEGNIDLNNDNNINMGSPKIETGLGVNVPKLQLDQNKIEIDANNNNNPTNIDFKIPDFNDINQDINPNINLKINKDNINPDLNLKINQNIKAKEYPNIYPNLSTNINGNGNIVLKDRFMNVKEENKNGQYLLSGIIQGVKDGQIISINKNKTLPSGSANLKGPKINTKGKINVKGPDIPRINTDLNATSQKFDIKGPKINNPEMNIQGNMPGININTKNPSFGVNLDQDFIPGKNEVNYNIKTPNVKLPSQDDIKGNLPGIKLEGPKIDANLPKINYDGIKMDGDIKIPNINGPTIGGDIKGLDFNGPKLEGDVNIKGPNFGGDVKGFDVNGPKVGVGADINGFDAKGLNFGGNINGPKIGSDVQGFDITPPKIGGGAININGPKIDGDIKGVNIKGPNINAKPDFYLSGLIHGTKTNKTNNSKINVKTKGINVKGPNINTKVNMPSGKINVKMPEMNTGGNINAYQNLEMPNASINVKTNQMNMPNANTPDFKLNSDLGGNINIGGNTNFNGNMPDVRIEPPKIGIKTTDVKFQGPQMNQKYDFFLSGTIPSKNDKNGKITLKQSSIPGVEISGSGQGRYPQFDDYYSKVNKIKFHGNIHDNDQGNLGNIKGHRSLLTNNNEEIKINIPKIHANNLGIGNDSNNDFGFGGGVNFVSNTPDFIKNENNQYGINLNVDGGMKTEDINVGMNFGQDSNDNKNLKSSGNFGISMKKKGGLPSVNPKSSTFQASKIGEAGHFDADNLNIDNLKTANVGVNGQKIGDRIIQ